MVHYFIHNWCYITLTFNLSHVLCCRNCRSSWGWGSSQLFLGKVGWVWSKLRQNFRKIEAKFEQKWLDSMGKFGIGLNQNLATPKHSIPYGCVSPIHSNTFVWSWIGISADRWWPRREIRVYVQEDNVRMFI